MKTKLSRLIKNLIEMGAVLKTLDLIDEETYKKITMRLLKKEKKNSRRTPLQAMKFAP